MIWVVGGTSDTRSLLDKLSEKIDLNNVIVSVTTEYGEKLLENFNIKVIQKVLDKKEILDFIDKTNINTIIDTSHPYAENISKNILEVIKSKNIKYFRYEREVTETIFDERFESLKDMISYINLNLKNKNILSTLGSKALEELINIQNNNVYVRILPTTKSIENAEKSGFLPNQILAIQGPFSETLEKEFLDFYKIGFMLTKDSGDVGGTDKKKLACQKLGVKILALSRPKVDYYNVFNNIDNLIDEICR